jgi:hypothetical protein
MTFDGTRVDTDELAAFSRGALDRAGRTTTAADTVAGTHLGSDMLGAFSLAFLDSGRADQTEIVSKLRAVAATLTEDGDVASTNAQHVGTNETTQTSRFTEKELP